MICNLTSIFEVEVQDIQDFGSLLSSFLDVLNLDLEYRSEIADHESALAQLESLTGVEIP